MATNSNAKRDEVTNAISYVLGPENQDSVLLILQTMQKDDWHLEKTSSSVGGILNAIAKLSQPNIEKKVVDSSELLGWLNGVNGENKSDAEKLAWVDACKQAVLLSSFAMGSGYPREACSEETFLAFWNVAHEWMAAEDKFKIGCEVLVKTVPSWSLATKKVLNDAKDCDWNKTLSFLSETPSGYKNTEEYVHSRISSGIPIEMQKTTFLPPIFLAKTKVAMEELVRHGADLEVEIAYKKTKIWLEERNQNWYASSDQRKQCLGFIEKCAPRDWTQNTAWLAIEKSKNVGDINRIAVACKKDWPDWRGPHGESFMHKVALHMPSALPGMFKRSECPEGIGDLKDNKGRDLAVWWVVGMMGGAAKYSDNSLRTIHSNVDKIPQLRKIEEGDIEAALLLSAQALTLRAEPEFVRGFGVYLGQVQACGFNYASECNPSPQSVFHVPSYRVNRYAKENSDRQRKELFGDWLMRSVKNGADGFPADVWNKWLQEGVGELYLRGILNGEIDDSKVTFVWRNFADSVVLKNDNADFSGRKIKIANALRKYSFDESFFENISALEMSPEVIFKEACRNIQSELKAAGWDEKVAIAWESLSLKKLVNVHKENKPIRTNSVL